MTDLQKIRLWEHLKKDFFQNIKDVETRKLYYKTLLIKATKEFGFNPESCDVKKQNDVVLDDWEKELVEDINDFRSFGFDNRVKKRQETNKETEVRMKDFILKGGNLKDIPEKIRTNTIEKLYYDCLFKLGDEILQESDNFIKK